MNEKDRVRRIMALKGVVVNYSRHRGGVYTHGDEFKHFVVKAAVFKVLQEAGHEVVTEAEFKSGVVADVLDATTGIVYEIQSDMSVDKTSPYMGIEEVQDVIVLDVSEFLPGGGCSPSDLWEMRESIKEEVVV